VERAVYINNNYNYNCPFKGLPDNVADEKNYWLTNLGVASPSAQFAVYLPLPGRRYSLLQCTAQWSLVEGSNFERLRVAHPLNPLSQGELVEVRV
jgi:hypothetical protein